MEVGPNRMCLGYISSQWISAVLRGLLLLLHLCSVGEKKKQQDVFHQMPELLILGFPDSRNVGDKFSLLHQLPGL